MSGVGPMLVGALGMLPKSRESALAAILLISLLSVIFLFALGSIVFIRRSLRRQAHGWEGLEREAQRTTPAFSYPIFDSRCRWLAIRNATLQEVQQALHLHNASPCSWADGLLSAQEHKLFISPPIQGWVLVMGSDLPDPAEDIDVCYHFLVRLSRSLGEVQFFSMNRIVNHHAWARLHEGRVLRAYAWAGETLWNEGRMTVAEQQLRMRCFNYFETTARETWRRSETAERPNADKVLALAAHWSLDPSSIEDLVTRQGPGIAGEFSFH